MGKRVRSHKLCEKWPLPAMFLSMLLVFVLTQLATIPAVSGAGSAFPLVSAVVSLVLLGLFRLWFAPDYKGSFRLGSSFPDMAKLRAVGLAYLVVDIIVSAIGSGEIYFQPSFYGLCLAISAGTMEEVAFRAFPAAIGMRYLKSRNHLAVIIIGSSVIFGLSHGFNILAGAAPLITVFQIIIAAMFGIYFCILFIRTGSILPGMVYHALNDFLSFSMSPDHSDGVMRETSIDGPGLICDLCFIAAVVVIAVLMIRRPQVKREIAAIWNDKWSVDNAKAGDLK